MVLKLVSFEKLVADFTIRTLFSKKIYGYAQRLQMQNRG